MSHTGIRECFVAKLLRGVARESVFKIFRERGWFCLRWIILPEQELARNPVATNGSHFPPIFSPPAAADVTHRKLCTCRQPNKPPQSTCRINVKPCHLYRYANYKLPAANHQAVGVCHSRSPDRNAFVSILLSRSPCSPPRLVTTQQASSPMASSSQDRQTAQGQK